MRKTNQPGRCWLEMGHGGPHLNWDERWEDRDRADPKGKRWLWQGVKTKP